jgi:hypothetical protein
MDDTATIDYLVGYGFEVEERYVYNERILYFNKDFFPKILFREWGDKNGRWYVNNTYPAENGFTRSYAGNQPHQYSAETLKEALDKMFEAEHLKGVMSFVTSFPGDQVES